MSTALAIAGVTATLRDLLNDGLVNGNVAGVLGSTVTVSALPPDRVVTGNGPQPTQLNLFLHQVTPNAAWRNLMLPSRDAQTGQRKSNPPLALDLHYLLTAYGAEDLHAEIMLGYAMQLLHENPVLRSEAVRAALDPGPVVSATLPPALRALADCGLADQVEQVRITPITLGGEEMSRLWSAINTHYRPSAAYVASLILIEAAIPVSAPLPVIERAIGVVPTVGPMTPSLDAAAGPGGIPAIAAAETLVLIGGAFGTPPFTAELEDRLTGERASFPAVAGAQPGTLDVALPAALPANLSIGLLAVSVRNADGRRSNAVGVVLRPRLTALPGAPIGRVAGDATIPVTVAPPVREGQEISLIVGDREVAPPPFAAPSQDFAFVVEDAEPGTHLVRVRIDGYDSEIIDRTADPPAFLASAQVTIT